MDGNGRWAQGRMLPRPLGHRSGMKAVREVVEGAIEVGVEVLSLFAFSSENWTRPSDEVSALMHLLEEYIAKEASELAGQGVRVHVLGELERLTPPAARAVAHVQEVTAQGTKLRLNLFISYGSRAEIVQATRALVADAIAGKIDPAQIDDAAIASRLLTAGCPDPDLLIRTSGEQRISNFLLWQVAYTELHISPVLWPDFTRADLYTAILDFQSRDRRFGRVSV
ncbi:MAG: di-trans,poly-cis-decaprenylcistransferase [Gemmatimonadaceae bacterium]|nr:di-trans,poly-cis-decaprenylcistransferase [Gemmatimonadaceae bacterium]